MNRTTLLAAALCTACFSTIGASVSAYEYDYTWDEVDADGDGVISEEEALIAWGESFVEVVLPFYDTDGDGGIQLQEMIEFEEIGSQVFVDISDEVENDDDAEEDAMIAKKPKKPGDAQQSEKPKKKKPAATDS